MNYTMNAVVAAVKNNIQPKFGNIVIAWDADINWLSGFVIGKLIGMDDDKFVVKTCYAGEPIYTYTNAVVLHNRDKVSKPPIDYEEGA